MERGLKLFAVFRKGLIKRLSIGKGIFVWGDHWIALFCPDVPAAKNA
jgi:hypothetical protein